MFISLQSAEYDEILEDEEGVSLKGVGEFIVAKNRQGETERAKLKWEAAYRCFSDLE